MALRSLEEVARATLVELGRGVSDRDWWTAILNRATPDEVRLWWAEEIRARPAYQIRGKFVKRSFPTVDGKREALWVHAETVRRGWVEGRIATPPLCEVGGQAGDWVRFPVVEIDDISTHRAFRAIARAATARWWESQSWVYRAFDERRRHGV